MRLASTAKCGYYPAHEDAVAGILNHLRLAEGRRETQFILDPCAGEGLAIKQIAGGLGVPFDQTYAVELDMGRSERIKDNVPGINLLGPATFMGVQISPQTFGLVYCNAPFDFEEGGGRREEQAFAMRSTHLLVPRGVLVLVCPINKLIGNRSFVQAIDACYEDIQVYKFPEEHRSYNEIVLFGRKRKQEFPHDAIYEHGELHKREWQWRGSVAIDEIPSLGTRQPMHWDCGRPSDDREASIRVWEIPHGCKPHTFKKTKMTEKELTEALEASPLRVHFKDAAPIQLKRPPLPLDKGHLGLILASGMLDGVVDGPHGPHVVRGSSSKVTYHNKEQSGSNENPDTGAVTTKDVFSERLVTVIRCVTSDGTIHTFSNGPKDADEDSSESAMQS